MNLIEIAISEIKSINKKIILTLKKTTDVL